MAVIDFRNTKQVFYDWNEIKEVWYMNEKLWEKKPDIDLSKYSKVNVRIAREDKTLILLANTSSIPGNVQRAVAFKSGKGNVYIFDQNSNLNLVSFRVVQAVSGDGFYEFLIKEYTEDELNPTSAYDAQIATFYY